MVQLSNPYSNVNPIDWLSCTGHLRECCLKALENSSQNKNELCSFPTLYCFFKLSDQ